MLDIGLLDPREMTRADAIALAKNHTMSNTDDMTALVNSIVGPMGETIDQNEQDLRAIYHPLVQQASQKVRNNERQLNATLDSFHNVILGQVSANHGALTNIQSTLRGNLNDDSSNGIGGSSDSVLPGSAADGTGGPGPTNSMGQTLPNLPGPTSDGNGPSGRSNGRPTTRPGITGRPVGVTLQPGPTAGGSPGARTLPPVVIQTGPMVATPRPGQGKTPGRSLKKRPPAATGPLPPGPPSPGPPGGGPGPSPGGTEPCPGVPVQPGCDPSIIGKQICGTVGAPDPPDCIDGAECLKCATEINTITLADGSKGVICGNPAGYDCSENECTKCPTGTPPAPTSPPGQCQVMDKDNCGTICNQIQLVYPLKCEELPDDLVQTLQDCNFNIMCDKATMADNEGPDDITFWAELLILADDSVGQSQ